MRLINLNVINLSADSQLTPDILKRYILVETSISGTYTWMSNKLMLRSYTHARPAAPLLGSAPLLVKVKEANQLPISLYCAVLYQPRVTLVTHPRT